jgi:hypothetical protein
MVYVIHMISCMILTFMSFKWYISLLLSFMKLIRKLAFQYRDIRYCTRYCTRYRNYHTLTLMSGPAILYPILYPISKLAYLDIGTRDPDAVPDIVPDIRNWMSYIGGLIPDIGAPWYLDQYQSAPISPSWSGSYRYWVSVPVSDIGYQLISELAKPQYQKLRYRARVNVRVRYPSRTRKPTLRMI